MIKMRSGEIWKLKEIEKEPLLEAGSYFLTNIYLCIKKPYR
ncbi:hypothetical protein ACFQ5E_03990 [Oceanobacillus sojae]